MKICLYFENLNQISKSGVGRAYKHQVAACEYLGIEYTTNYKEEYDILHINTTLYNASRVIRNARKRNKKVIYHAHSTKEDFENSFKFSNQIAPLFKKHLVKLYSKADLILTPTDYSKQLLETYNLGVDIKAISNGIDLTRFEPSETKKEAFIKHFNIQPDQKVIISVGLFFKRKGIHDFIELAKQMPEYTFIWFGHTPLASVPKDIAQAINNKSENCHFPGYIAGNIIEGAFRYADCFVFMSYEETEGIVVLEALASNQQVIVRDIPVYADWLKDQENCYKCHNLEEFKANINKAIQNPNEIMKNNGYEVAKERDIKNVALQLKSYYELVLNQENKKAL